MKTIAEFLKQEREIMDKATASPPVSTFVNDRNIEG
jgi:hypothetical protein